MVLTKEAVEAARKEFFDQCLVALNTPPQPIDEALEQNQYYVAPSEAHGILDEKLGDFLVVIDPVFSGQRWPLSYSLWQIGDVLKIAIIFQGLGDQAPSWDPEEFNTLWGFAPQLLLRGNKSFHEWTFSVPDFHTNYATREKFSLGLRHMHFRTIKVLRAMADKSRP